LQEKPVFGVFSATIEHGSGRHFKVASVWFAPSWEILFNSDAGNQMGNEPFSRVFRHPRKKSKP
jgi:hypothetical protein